MCMCTYACIIVSIACSIAPDSPVRVGGIIVSRSQTASPSILYYDVIGRGEGSGTLPMRRLCGDSPEARGRS